MYRIDALLKQNQPLFHTRDLSLLWGITNNNHLYTTIKRYVDKGILIPIHKGFYSTLPLNQVDILKLGTSYLHRYAYVSCESVLSLAGIIFQAQNYLTLISSVSRKFTVASHHFLVRKLADAYLLNDAGITSQNSVLIASTARAVADLLYYNPRYHFDNLDAIDWTQVAVIQKQVGYL